MAPWTKLIEGLIYGQDNSNDNGSLAGPSSIAIEKMIEKRMALSQQGWKKKTEKAVNGWTRVDRKGPPTKPKVREDWSEAEDAELMRLVRWYGKGSWKDILDESAMLKKRYEMSPTGKPHEKITGALLFKDPTTVTFSDNDDITFYAANSSHNNIFS
jgi:hypothetical protein